MATAQLATQGYRIAKSWQYQENLPDPTQATSVAGSGQESPRDNNNSFFVSSSLNHQRSATANEKFDSGKNPKKFLGIFPCRTRDGDRDDPNLRRPLILTGQQESRQTDDGWDLFESKTGFTSRWISSVVNDAKLNRYYKTGVSNLSDHKKINFFMFRTTAIELHVTILMK